MIRHNLFYLFVDCHDYFCEIKYICFPLPSFKSRTVFSLPKARVPSLLGYFAHSWGNMLLYISNLSIFNKKNYFCRFFLYLTIRLVSKFSFESEVGLRMYKPGMQILYFNTCAFSEVTNLTKQNIFIIITRV